MSCVLDTVTVCSDGVTFDAESRTTIDPIKAAADRPYSVESAMFRLYSDHDLQPGDRIDAHWRITEVETPAKGRKFCKAVRIHLRNEVMVDLVELTKRQGPDAKTIPVTRFESVVAGKMIAGESSRQQDDRRMKSGDILFCLCEHVSEIVAGRWQVSHAGKLYKVLRIVDVDRLDRAATVVCSPDHRRV